jgi:hypothetical protein
MGLPFGSGCSFEMVSLAGQRLLVEVLVIFLSQPGAWCNVGRQVVCSCLGLGAYLNYFLTIEGNIWLKSVVFVRP